MMKSISLAVFASLLIVASAQSYGNGELAQAVNAALASYKSSGAFAALVSTWYGDASIASTDLCTATYPSPTAGGTLSKVITSRVLNIGINVGPPLHFNSSNGVLTGFDVPLINAILSRLSTQYPGTAITANYIPTPFADLLTGVNAGTFDLASGGILKNTARMASNILSCNMTVGAYSAIILSSANYTTLADLNVPGTVIGAIAQSSQDLFAKAANPLSTFTAVPDATTALTLLQNGTIMAWVTTQTTAGYTASSSTGISKINNFGPVSSTSYGFRKDTTTSGPSSTSHAGTLVASLLVVAVALVAVF